MEKLYELAQRGPLRPARARHAADAQRARLPRRAAASSPRFIEGRSLQLLPAPDRLGAARSLGRGTGVLFCAAEAGHRRRPARGPLGVLPQLRRHGRRLPRARRARSTRCSPTSAARSWWSPRRARTRSTRRPSSTAAARGRAAVRGRGGQSRAHAVPAHRADVAAEVRTCWARARAQGRPHLGRGAALAARDRAGLRRFRAAARRAAADRGPATRRRRARPRRPGAPERPPLRPPARRAAAYSDGRRVVLRVVPAPVGGLGDSVGLVRGVSSAATTASGSGSATASNSVVTGSGSGSGSGSRRSRASTSHSESRSSSSANGSGAVSSRMSSATLFRLGSR